MLLLQVVTENTPFKQGYIAISSLGFGGANAHVVIKPTLTNKVDKTTVEKPKHRLVLSSGRTPEAVNLFIDGLIKYQDDLGFLTLINEIHKMDIDRHNYRG